MNPVIIIVGLFALYVLLENRNLGSLLNSGSTGTGTPAQAGLAPVDQGGQLVSSPGYTLSAGSAQGPSNTTTTLVGSGLATGAGVGTSIAVSSGVLTAGSTLAVAIPVIGVAAAAIFGVLMAASAKRAREARNENSAVAKEVPAWDNAVQQVVTAYNQGRITLQELYHGMMVPQNNDTSVPSGQGVLWQAYWNVVGPQQQPGRNGCHGGADIQPSTQSWCGGNAASVDSRTYGAGCCVAYDNLKNGSVYIMQAAKQAEASPGRAITSKQIPMVYASKYGGINRPGYTVTLKKPAVIGV